MSSLQDYREFRSKYNYYGHHLGVVITEMEEGRAKCEMPVRQELFNPIGSVNGGAMFSLADTTCSAAAAAYGMRMTTLDADFHFLAPGMNAKVIYGEAIEIKKGRTTAVYEVKITDDKGTLLACGTFTFYDLNKPLLEGDTPKPYQKKQTPPKEIGVLGESADPFKIGNAAGGKSASFSKEAVGDIKIPDIGSDTKVKKSVITDHGTDDDFPIDTIIC